MKNIYKVSLIAAALAIFAGCQTEPLDTDQFGDSLTLSAFSPNPIYRGGELTIIGSYLEQVTQVIVPGVDPITSINVVESGAKSRITVTLPNTTEEEGTISIVGKDGTKLTSLATLTYTEPIVFTDFTPKSAMPGDVITITGDYMNLIEEVIFNDGVIASGDAITSKSRTRLTVVVPAAAVSGRIILGDSDEAANPDVVANKSYSEDELVIGSPVVSSLSVVSPKPGETVTISGTYLNMIETIVFGGGVTVSEFTVSEDNKSLYVTIPASAASGDVVAISYAGEEFTAGSISMTVPTGLVASPSPVKAGQTLEISGKDLDIITAMDFPNASGATFYYSNGSLLTTVPAAAQEGDIVLTASNGESVSVAYTLVHPAITSVSPVEIVAGESFAVTGTDLDLVTKVSLGGKAVEFEGDASRLSITTDATSVTGTVVLGLANGETVESEETVTVSYDSWVIVNSMPASAPIGALVTLKGQNFNMVETIYIGEAKVTGYTLRVDDELDFIMPYNLVGDYSIFFHLYNGDVEEYPQKIHVDLEQVVTVIWEGEEDMGSWSNQPYLGAETAFGDTEAAVGDKVRIYYTPNADWYQFQIFDGHWGGMSFEELSWGNTVSPESVPEYKGYFEFTITEQILSQINNPQNWGGALLTQGENCTITMVTLVKEISQEKVVWEGSRIVDNWTNWDDIGTEDDWVNTGLEVGKEVRLYLRGEPNVDYWQIQLYDGHWGGLSFEECGWTNNFNPENSDLSKGYISFKVTQDIFNALTSKQWWGCALIVQGEGGLELYKIAFI